eukprot:6103087-Ditylum_brightwellii.AAC.1
MTASMSGMTARTTSETRSPRTKIKRVKTSRIKSTKRAIIAKVAPVRTTTCPTMNQKRKQKQKVNCSAPRYLWAYLEPSWYSSDWSIQEHQECSLANN